MNIRPVLSDERSMLFDMIRNTFIGAFGDQNTTDNMESYVSEKLNDKTLGGEFEDTNSKFFFSDDEHKITGYLKLNIGSAQTEQQFPNGLEIERIYVLEGNQGRGIGQELIQFSLSYAEGKGLSPIWLGVWEENKSAMRFYERQGFKAFGSHTFWLGRDQQTDILMSLHI